MKAEAVVNLEIDVSEAVLMAPISAVMLQHYRQQKLLAT